MIGCGSSIAGEVEKISDLIVNGQKLLDLSRRFEPFHDPLSSPRRLMGIFRPIVQTVASENSVQLTRGQQRIKT